MVEPVKQYDLFVSYANTDRAWVEGYLLDSLRGTGVNYHSETAFTLGAVRLLEFERAIEQSKRTLLVISSAYLADGSNEFISLLAQCYGFESATWPVIPLILEPVKLPPRLSVLVKLNATNQEEREESIERLCAELQRPIPAPLPKPARPYPGMIPFREEDSNLYPFFGRDKEIEDMVRRLRKQQFLTVIGPSGSGKSSLVFAGLIPALRRRDFGPGDWLFCTLRTGRTPLTDLTRLLNGNLNNPTEAINTVLATQLGTQRLLLVVDQFEETFTQAKEEAISFQKALLSLIGTAKCWVILTVRADFYSDLMESPLWQQIKEHRLEVTPLDEASLRDAIVKPAEKVGVFVESALVERLVRDAAGEPGVLPLVQETLALLWEKLERRFLPLSAYNALVLTRKAYGEDGEHPNGLQVAIADLADNALRSLENDTQRAIARRIFLRLVQFGEGRADTRRQQTVNELRSVGDDPQLLDQTLKHLADEKWRLLTMTSGEQNTSIKVDISHEALIVGWDTLRDWIAQRRGAELIRRQLSAKAQEWVRLGRSNGGLLDEVELVEAERWLSTSDATELGYDESLSALVEESRKALIQRRNQQRRALLTLGGLGCLVLVAGGFGWLQHQRAQSAVREAQIIDDFASARGTPEVLSKLPDLLKVADEERTKDTKRALGKYQKVMQFIQYVRKDFTKNRRAYSNDAEEQINKISTISEDAVVKIVYQNLMKTLEQQLSQGKFGEVNYADSTNLEERYSQGALLTTAQIIMSDTGIGADLNHNGTIDTPDEANLIPCPILKKIEILWRQNTANRCGWYGADIGLGYSYHDAPTCSRELDKTTLIGSMIRFPFRAMVDRLNFCPAPDKIALKTILRE